MFRALQHRWLSQCRALLPRLIATMVCPTANNSQYSEYPNVQGKGATEVGMYDYVCYDGELIWMGVVNLTFIALYACTGCYRILSVYFNVINPA